MKHKILIFYHHNGDLGHSTRVRNICKSLRDGEEDSGKLFDIVVVNSGVKQDFVGIRKYAHVVNMPPLTFGEDGIDGLGYGSSERKAIYDRMLRYGFNSAIFEHYPFGLYSFESELAPFIQSLNDNGCKCFGSVRDVILQKQDKSLIQSRLDLLKGVFVHSDSRHFLLGDYNYGKELFNHSLKSSIKSKLIFVGRMFSVSESLMLDRGETFGLLKKNFNYSNYSSFDEFVDSVKLIVLSVGGGSDGHNFLKRFIQVKSRLDFDCVYLVSVGPNVSVDVYDELKVLVEFEKNILLTKYNPSIQDYIRISDLSVSMAGYNSFNDFLAFKKNTLFFPRYTNLDQIERCKIFGVEFFLESKYNDRRLIDLINDCLYARKIVSLEFEYELKDTFFQEFLELISKK